MRFARRIFGGDVDEAIRPLVLLQAFGSLSASALFTFVGIWALQRLDASETQLGIAFLLMAGSAMFTGLVGGHLSDRIGRRPMMLVGRGFFCFASLGALAAGENTIAGLAVIVATGALSSLGDAAAVRWWPTWSRPRSAGAYAALRVAATWASVLGPPIGGLLLAVSWNTLFVGAAFLSAISWALAWRLIPRRGRYTPERGEKSERLSVASTIVRSWRCSAAPCWHGSSTSGSSCCCRSRWCSTTASTGRCGA